MKTLNTLLAFMFTGIFCFGQVTVQTNLLPSIAPNTNLTLEVKISKGAISNFSKYQMDVPAGVTVKEGSSRTGNFSFEAGRAKIVWVSIPAEPEFIVSFNVNTGTASGPVVFNHRFFYVEDGGKREVDLDPINVTMDAGGATVLAALDPEGKLTPAKTETETASNTGNATPTNTETVVNTQTTAPTNTDTASNTNTTAATNTDVAVTNTTSSNTSTETTTSKELTFAEKLDAHHEKHSEPEEKVAKKAPEKKTPEKKVTPEKPVNAEEKTTETAGGIVFKVQLGAYGADPGKAKFSKAGKVSINKEGGYYKVLLGSFKSKEDAINQLNELKGKGIDGFVVSYENGVRVK